MTKPLAFDLFSGAGGAALGLKQAGFYVVGFDIKTPSAYTGDEFVQADVHDLPIKSLKSADFVWASPPCQEFSTASQPSKAKGRTYPDLIQLTRDLLKEHPWTCIENVPLAPLRQDLILWGQQFGFYPTEEKDGLWRKRIFELSFFAWNPPKPKMNRLGGYASITGCGCPTATYKRRLARGQRATPTPIEMKEQMGIPAHIQMTRKEIVESVPPAYSFYIATEAMSRMQEAGYIGKRQRASQARYSESLSHAETLTEVPF